MRRPAPAASPNRGCLIQAGLVSARTENLSAPQGPPGTKTPFPHCKYVKVHMGSWGMSPGEAAASYRLYAVYCAEIAQTVTDSGRKVALLDMAQAWAKLAEHVDKDSPPAEASAVTP